MDFDKLNAALKAISVQFHDALSRCEHCGKEGEVFDCDECKHNKEQFASAFVDLLNLIEPDPYKRFLLALYATNPTNPIESHITDR